MLLDNTSRDLMQHGGINQTFMVVSVFTYDNIYYNIILDNLHHSLNALNINYHLKGVPNAGNWWRNLLYKPMIIKWMMDRYPDKNILFLDADARLVRFPDLFEKWDNQYDVGLFYLDRAKWYGIANGRKELVTSTIFVKNTYRTSLLMADWETDANGDGNTIRYEQTSLEKVVDDNKKDIRVLELPLEYCYITSLPDGKEPNIKVERPVITQHQASRTCRKIVGERKW